MLLIESAYLAALGGLIIAITWLPMFLRRLPLTLPIICAGLGMLVGALVPGAHVSLFYNSRISKDLAEGALVMALLGAGLKIDRPFTLRGWQTTWRLLGIAMPITIAALSYIAVKLGQWPLGAALFLGAALAPTDPVLASAVSVGPPGRGEEGEIRFGLTSEAALNDGLAYPFVSLAILVNLHALAGLTAGWAARTFLADVLGGLAVGWVLGRLFGWMLFRFPVGRLSDTGDGMVAIGLAVITFAATEAIGLNGFLGVFATALGIRASCPKARFHLRMTSFTGQLERLFTYLLLVGFGAAVGSGVLAPLRWRDAALGLILIAVLRPASGWLSLIGSPHPAVSRVLTAFFGIRGISALYYLLYALGAGHFPDSTRLAATVGFAVLCSIVIHGVASTPLMQFADTRREQRLKQLREQRGEV